ncbi:MAG: DUF11 domain-containing protein [Candidatus Pacebacteria bacterium]|nr:DUF11 domain-containing protein [Candidatus Paceibacterota bacterium]MCF7856873.1 DUF11 domain-containing protein [Candidatus Paceibacterota bacterium]
MSNNDRKSEDQKTLNEEANTSNDNARARAQQEAERIGALRERLYSRGNVSTPYTRHTLKRNTSLEQTSIPQSVKPKPQPSPVMNEIPKEVDVSTSSNGDRHRVEENAIQYSDMVSNKRKSFRKKTVLLGVVFFVVALATSSLFMLSGTNTISGENISINVAGPIAIGGGEEMPFQVSIANQNTVAIQAATLIIEYPSGTHSSTESNKEIGIVRQSLDTIGTGELINVPLKARFFGGENDEKEIKVSIEYRIAGSNATFRKAATPLRFKVSTSPIVMTFDSIKTISSNQEITLKLTIQSNSPTVLTDILVKTSYPLGFDFTESDVETVSGEDTWKFSSLKPNEKKTVTIKGLMTGYEDEVRKFTATAGVANETDKNTLTSTLASASTEIIIEQPFLDVEVLVNGISTETVVISTDEIANIEIRYKNVLDTAIYDGKVLVELGGNALNEFTVGDGGGFYNSTNNTLTLDSADEKGLEEILPGRMSKVFFTIKPKENIGRAPEVKLNVTVKGQRIFEDRAAQELVGTVSKSIKIESIPTLASSVVYEGGPFMNTGPTPPIAEKMTQYTYKLVVKSGANDVTGAELTAVVPQYVNWLDLVTDGDTVTYNATTRTIKWNIGDLSSNTEVEVSMQVSFIPSFSQVGKTPTLLEAQRLKATDRFTGTVIRAEHPALTTGRLGETDEALRDGKVRAE